MKKRDIIIVTLSVAVAIVCIALTFWGNMKNNGVLTIDAYIGVIATLIGVCATIVVGFQIASFVKIHETERQIKEVQTERNNMQKEKEELFKNIELLEIELSNAFIAIANTVQYKSVRSLICIMSIHCNRKNISDGNVLLSRYKLLRENIEGTNLESKILLSSYTSKLKSLDIPKEIEHYTEIMKLHIEVIDILEHAAEETETNNQEKQV